MTAEELNKKAERLVELYKDRRKTKACRARVFKELYGDGFNEYVYDTLIANSKYPQDEEINELTNEIKNGLTELGLSEIITNSVDFKHYCYGFRVEYVPFRKNEYNNWFEEES